MHSSSSSKFRRPKIKKIINSKKAQFMILTAFLMVSVFYLISRWIEPYNLLDTAEVVLIEEPFVFNNIKEKAIELVSTSASCAELVANLEEYKIFIEDYAFKKLIIYFDYTLETPCYEDDPLFPVLVIFNIELQSEKITIRDEFYGFWPPDTAPI
jgi:hypothetical protein